MTTQRKTLVISCPCICNPYIYLRTVSYTVCGYYISNPAGKNYYPDSKNSYPEDIIQYFLELCITIQIMQYCVDVILFLNKLLAAY